MYVFSRICREWHVLLLSISIFTRLPIQRNIPNDQNIKLESYKYSVIVGLLIGLLSALVYDHAQFHLSKSISVLLSMLVSLLCVRLGHSESFFVPITQSSQVPGSEVLASKAKSGYLRWISIIEPVSFFIIKYSMLMQIDDVFLAIVLAHSLSYATAYSVVYTHEYLEKTDKWIKIKQVVYDSQDDVITLVFISMAVLFVNPNSKLSCMIMLFLVATRIVYSFLISRQIILHGKYIMNTIQRFSELICYMVIWFVLL